MGNKVIECCSCTNPSVSSPQYQLSKSKKLNKIEQQSEVNILTRYSEPPSNADSFDHLYLSNLDLNEFYQIQQLVLNNPAANQSTPKQYNTLDIQQKETSDQEIPDLQKSHNYSEDKQLYKEQPFYCRVKRQIRPLSKRASKIPLPSFQSPSLRKALNIIYNQIINFLMRAIYLSRNWPQPQVTAASVRMVGIIRALQNIGYQSKFVSIKKPNQFQLKTLNEMQIDYDYCQSNDLQQLRNVWNQPDICIFDTFLAEEMFGHMVYEISPDTLRILDLQDLHSLRQKRQELYTQKASWYQIKAASLDLDKDQLFLREIASILRSDITIFCSYVEQQMLLKKFSFLNTLLLTFFYENLPDYDIGQRENIVWIGHFKHPPNQDSVKIMHELWPQINKLIPQAQLHIYGSHSPQHPPQCPKNMFYCGEMKHLSDLQRYRLMVAPIPYGAGIKGKITDSWYYGLPVVTTELGIEGLPQDGALVQNDWNCFAQSVAELYQNQNYQKRIIEKGRNHICNEFSMQHNQNLLQAALKEQQKSLVAKVLFQQQYKASSYFTTIVELNRKIRELNNK